MASSWRCPDGSARNTQGHLGLAPKGEGLRQERGRENPAPPLQGREHRYVGHGLARTAGGENLSRGAGRLKPSLPSATAALEKHRGQGWERCATCRKQKWAENRSVQRTHEAMDDVA